MITYKSSHRFSEDSCFYYLDTQFMFYVLVIIQNLQVIVIYGIYIYIELCRDYSQYNVVLYIHNYISHHLGIKWQTMLQTMVPIKCRFTDFCLCLLVQIVGQRFVLLNREPELQLNILIWRLLIFAVRVLDLLLLEVSFNQCRRGECRGGRKELTLF